MPLMTPVGMIMFPNLFTPRQPAPNTESRYSLVLLLDEAAQKDPAWDAVKQAVAAEIDKKFGAGKARDVEWLQRVKFQFPWRNAGEKEKYAGFTTDKLMITPWSKTKPGLVDGRLQPIHAPADVWAGQLGRVTVKPWGYQVSGNTGCNLMLDNVQITRADMPRMDGRLPPEQSFPPIEEPGALVSTADELPWR